METAADVFDRMIRYCDEIVLPPFARERVVKQLEYFCLQARCDFAHQENLSVISMHWLTFKADRWAASVVEHFKNDPVLWPLIAGFVGEKSDRVARQPNGEINFAESADLFTALGHRAKTMIPEAEYSEKLLVSICLRYLHLEFRRKKYERDYKYIRFVWQLVAPVAERFGVTDGYRGYPRFSRLEDEMLGIEAGRAQRSTVAGD